MDKERNIYLTGFMGAGKTTIGKQLSEKLMISVIDTDQYIEEKQNKKISEIFAEEGETKFRELESEALQIISEQSPKIITTGGGIVLNAQNRQLMKEKGKVVFLYCDLQETMQRLANDQTRPLFKANYEANKQRFVERLPLYKEADVTIETTNRCVEDIINELVKLLD